MGKQTQLAKAAGLELVRSKVTSNGAALSGDDLVRCTERVGLIRNAESQMVYGTEPSTVLFHAGFSQDRRLGKNTQGPPEAEWPNEPELNGVLPRLSVHGGEL